MSDQKPIVWDVEHQETIRFHKRLLVQTQRVKDGTHYQQQTANATDADLRAAGYVRADAPPEPGRHIAEAGDNPGHPVVALSAEIDRLTRMIHELHLLRNAAMELVLDTEYPVLKADSLVVKAGGA